jgi:hypothetical protein
VTSLICSLHLACEANEFFFFIAESREKQEMRQYTIQFRRRFHHHSTMSLKDLPTSKPLAPIATSSANASSLLLGNH